MNLDSSKILRHGSYFLVAFSVLLLLYVDLGPWEGLGTRYRRLNLEAARYILTGHRDVHQWREEGITRPYVTIKEEIHGAGTEDPQLVGWKFNYYTDVNDVNYNTAVAFTLTKSGVMGMYISLLLLPALILLTPSTWLRRLRNLVIGLVLLTILHILMLAFYGFSEGYFRLYEPTTWFQQRVYKGMLWGTWKVVWGIQGQFLAIAIWALLSWRDLFELFDKRESSEEAPASEPELELET